MANRTTGKRRGASGRPGSRPATEDVTIRQRAREGWRMWAEDGLSVAEIAKHFGVSRDTICNDRAMLVDDYRSEGVAEVHQHVLNLRRRQADLHKVIGEVDGKLADVSDKSVNLGHLLSQKRQSLMDIAKLEMEIARLDGSLRERVALEGSALVVQYLAPDSVPAAPSSPPDPR